MATNPGVGPSVPLTSSDFNSGYSAAPTDGGASSTTGLSTGEAHLLENQIDRMTRRVKRMEDARESCLCGLFGDDDDQAEVDASMDEMRRLIASSRASSASRNASMGEDEGEKQAQEEKERLAALEMKQAYEMDAAILTLKSAKDGRTFTKVLNDSVKQDWLNYDALHGNIYRVWAFGCLVGPSGPGTLQARWWEKKLRNANNQALAEYVREHVDTEVTGCFCFAKDYGPASELLNGTDIDDPDNEIWDIVVRGNLRYRKEWCFRANFCTFMTTLFKLMGCWCVLLIQTIGPFATVLSCILCWGIPHENRYDWRKFRDCIGLKHWYAFSGPERATKIVAALFIFSFNLNGWFIVVAEGATWAKVHRVFKFLNCDSKEHLRESWLIAGAWINCFAVLFCCLCVPVYVGDSDTVLDVFMDSLALLFLFNLDDVGGDLGFVSEQDWPGWELAWVYEVKLKKRTEPSRALFSSKCPFISLPAATLLMYKIVGYTCMLTAFTGPFCAVLVNWEAMKFHSDAAYMEAWNMTGSVYR